MELAQIFGELTFNDLVMREKLSKELYTEFMNTIHIGKSLDKAIADNIAHAMKEWAIEKGATHFTHWFQPLRGGTAEKHDSFLQYDENGKVSGPGAEFKLVDIEIPEPKHNEVSY